MKLIILAVLMTSLYAEARPVRGTYEVPAPADLRNFSSFPVKFKSEEYDNGQKAITFPLPVELTGKALSLSMAETNEPGVWKGPQVDGNCKKIGRIFECSMTFTDLEIDDAAVAEVLTKKHPLEADLQRALELSGRFKAEPAGILRYRLRGRED